MKTKLVWKDKAKRGVMKGTVVGHFAMWAVRQSPYLLPENLVKGIEEFDKALSSTSGYIETTYKELKEVVGDIILNSKIISSWNVAKSRRSGAVFVTRYSEPDPDDDFIDLDALARNIAQSVWLELCYDDGFFESKEDPEVKEEK